MEEYINLVDENGEEVEFKFISKFKVEDRDYAALLPRDEEEVIYILRVKFDKEENILLEGIEDDEELEKAIEVFENQGDLENN